MSEHSADLPGTAGPRVVVTAAAAAWLALALWCGHVVISVGSLREDLAETVDWLSRAEELRQRLGDVSASLAPTGSDAPVNWSIPPQLEAELLEGGLVSNAPVDMDTISEAQARWTPAARGFVAAAQALARGTPDAATVLTTRHGPVLESVIGRLVASARGAARAHSEKLASFWSALYVLTALALVSTAGLALVALRLRSQAQELRESRDAAEAGARAKSQFLATMSHEIRTPMNAVSGMTALMLHTDMTDEQRDYVRSIDSASHALLAVVDDILDYSKAEADRLVLAPRPFDLREACEQTAVLLRAAPDAAGIALETSYPEAAPRRFIGDADRVRQLLLNLTGNALKFTPRGTVRIEVDCEPAAPAGQAASRVEVRVTDTGVGIPDEKLPLLFERFSQADSSTTRQFRGTGLGLAICERLVHEMAGEIGVSSLEGRGSAFWFAIPLPHAPEADPPVAAPAPHAPDARAAGPQDAAPLRVLVVDDTPVNLKVAAAMLRRLGCGVDTAGGGRECLERVRDAEYDLVLMDVQMPGMDGFETTAALRKPGAAAGGPRICAMTANAMRGDRERCLAAGMNDYLSKPFGLDDLQAVLDRARV